MSAEMTPLGIRVNCVHPGLIDTDMTAWIMKSADVLPGILAQISLGRAGAPREIGAVAAFFLRQRNRVILPGNRFTWMAGGSGSEFHLSR